MLEYGLTDIVSGYRQLIYIDGYNSMMKVIYTRGLLAIGGHVVWAAVSGAAISIASAGDGFDWTDLLKKDFLMLFIVPVVCHGIWDWAPLGQYIGLPYGDYILLIVFIWIVVLVLLRRGIAEINQMAGEEQ